MLQAVYITQSMWILLQSFKMGLLSQSKLLLLLSHFLLASSSSHYPTLPYSPSEPPSYHHRHHHHNHHNHHPQAPVSSPAIYPPVEPPVHPPTHLTHPPLKTPVHLPAKPPSTTYPPATSPAYHPLPRKAVAVQGVVYCKNCTYFGVDTLISAKPLAGASVVLKCKNTVYTTKKTATTDKNGYFFMEAPKTVTSYGSRKCHVYLAEPPAKTSCIHPTNLNGGVSGALLFKPGKTNNITYALFDVGPFAFEPPRPYCRKN